MASLKDVAKKLQKAYGLDNMLVRADVVPDIERLPTKCLKFNYAMYGGLPYRRIIEFNGRNSSGKSLAAFTMLAAYQKERPNEVCVYVDAEKAVDLHFMSKMTGVDLSKLYYVNPDTLGGEDILQTILDIQQTDEVGMIVLDSISVLQPAIVLDSEMSEDKGMRNSMAKSNQRFIFQMANLVAKKGNIFLFINQVRESKNAQGLTLYSEPGGAGLKYASSVRLRFGNAVYTKDGKEIANSSNSPKVKESDGLRLSFAIIKNKTSDTRRGGGTLSFRFDIGLDIYDDLFEVGKDLNYILTNGSYYTLTDIKTGEILTENGKELKFQGKEKVLKYFSENKEFSDSYFNQLTEALSKVNKSLLDEKTYAEIWEEENKING